ncbi:MAG: UDP-N-acetylglucosamine 2-epimerase (hydrolyzing) [Bacteroidia bacterium]|nr:UDP-N-acetylglucosamine 2-epimerase (hydrolyzing) [Bacteroidia bacterium]NNF32450.1 UDP-N-acetylglucosamine 2-epimerase (hydrolyzing) [Flavobacteriaceae bacterium]MBT8267892.1 UDP-N-acetylglucosamine 2-epimerase (hydrolyzing) [Bacteroidia bacterium]MBT8276140.1 UDP-N-acetylglucosamine 2-epimerase (hydrolyzing) [Bacteroidia bacterium]NNJ81717.1 UDP-N-acetylglucosamine 2-epimerase (hydrolyzing) [Flavobacteriaceae bacterium]
MNKVKRIVFLTGTRADFGKLKSLIQILDKHPGYEPHIFVTGMHLLETYGYTLIEVQRAGFSNIHTFSNHTSETTMDLTLAKTVEGFSAYVKDIQPDLIVIHGDRVEALAGALVGSLNNVLVAHVEGGEISGTIDELLRHATSKMSHVHFVANKEAQRRLVQMGELPESIFIIGSPDIDVMFSNKLPSLEMVKDHYEISFENYSVVLFHPVTTEASKMGKYATMLAEALVESKQQYVIIYPNNDLGSAAILDSFKPLTEHKNIRMFPSIRFEYFLTLLKNARSIIGNSSAGIREAPYYGIPTINIGNRQENRALHSHIINVDYSKDAILNALKKEPTRVEEDHSGFGNGNSDQLFLQSLLSDALWEINHQKQFKDL